MNRDALISELVRDEGKRPAVYDDADGKPIIPGKKVLGHATVGVGRALDVCPLDDVEIAFLLGRDLDKIEAALTRDLPCFATLDEVRQRVLMNMAFNMGVSGLLSFRDTLGHVSRGEYPEAAIAMEESSWYKQVGARAVRLAAMMKNGTT